MVSIFDVRNTDFGRLSCILRRPPDAKICHRLAVAYFSFSKVNLRVLQNERRNKDFSNCDFSRFFVKNNCMLRWPNFRNWSKSVKILSVFFRKIKKSWNFGSEHEFGRFRISNAWKWIVSGRNVEFDSWINQTVFFGGSLRDHTAQAACDLVARRAYCVETFQNRCVFVRSFVRPFVRPSAPFLITFRAAKMESSKGFGPKRRPKRVPRCQKCITSDLRSEGKWLSSEWRMLRHRSQVKCFWTSFATPFGRPCSAGPI